MTICIAAICEQGSQVIMASDAMITNEALSIEFEHPGQKLTELSRNGAALTAGDALAHTELFNTVKIEIDKLKSPSTSEIVEKIKSCYTTIREREIKEKFLIPRGFSDFEAFYALQRQLVPDLALTTQSQIDNYDYGLEILVGGVDSNVAHIYGIYDPGTSKCFDAIGFHAIGSGLPHAINTFIAKDYTQSATLKEALLIIYEAKKLSEKAPGVGSNITDISVISNKGIINFPRSDVSELDKIYRKQRSGEENWANEIDSLLKKLNL